MEFSGFAHVTLTVSKFEDCVKFYNPVMEFLGMRPYVTGPTFRGWYGGEAMFVILHAAPSEDKFSQWRSGLHHLSFRARDRAQVDALGGLLVRIGARMIHPPEEGPFWPGYYSVLCEDPEGIRLEMNYLPQAGWDAVRANADKLASGT